MPPTLRSMALTAIAGAAAAAATCAVPGTATADAGTTACGYPAPACITIYGTPEVGCTVTADVYYNGTPPVPPAPYYWTWQVPPYGNMSFFFEMIPGSSLPVSAATPPGFSGAALTAGSGTVTQIATSANAVRYQWVPATAGADRLDASFDTDRVQGQSVGSSVLSATDWKVLYEANLPVTVAPAGSGPCAPPPTTPLP